jgi:hypothetical protein
LVKHWSSRSVKQVKQSRCRVTEQVPELGVQLVAVDLRVARRARCRREIALFTPYR